MHLARYKWIQRELEKLKVDFTSVFELGCFDGKLIDWLPEREFRYVGMDANWDGGLDIAWEKYADHPEYEFIESSTPEELPDKEKFDISVSMETLEHVNPAQLDAFLQRLANLTGQYCFVTVPNEIGPVFFAKNIVKMFMGSSRNYSFKEFFYHCLGRTDCVSNPKGGHKGFSYLQFIREFKEHFELVKTVGIPNSILPPYLNFGVGLIGRPKK